MRHPMRNMAAATLVCVALAGCEDGQGFPNFGTNDDATDASNDTVAAQQSPQSVLKDVERPDIFNVTDMALWDGRPSLGGVWVAHPDIKTPERVLVTNTKTGKTIPGALFRRERENPGPVFQASSEAAALLGMLAGAPAELKVLAVRQEEVIIEPEPVPVVEGDEISDEELATAGVVDDLNAEVPETIEEEPKRGNFLQRLFRRKPAENAAIAAGGVAAAETVDDASAPDVETSTLDPVASSAAAAIARAEASDKPEPRPERASAADPTPTPSAPALRNPFIQVGLFSVEANANAAAANLRQSGIIPTIDDRSTNGVLTWRVLVGPVTTADDQAALLGQVKNLGFKDAFLTNN